MWSRLIFLLTACQIFYLISALSSPKIIHLPPESPDELYLGCYETPNNESDLYQPRLSTLSPYKCIEVCAYEMFPLAAVLNDTECHCVNATVTPLIKTDPCSGSPKSTNRFEVYNTSCLLVEFVEIYQELTFTTFPPKIKPSVSSSVKVVTSLNVTVTNSSHTIVYSVDFGDKRSNATRVLRHHYLDTGEFNITLVASRDASTIFVLSRRIRVLSRPKVANVSCSALKPNCTVECKLYGLRGSDITASMAMHNRGQNVSLLVPDVPRLVIGSKGVPITNQSHAKNESGAYLLPSLQFTTEATVEAWEVYAESPGRIQLQIYRAILNLTKCTESSYQHSSCGNWTPASGGCNQVCIKLIYWQKPSIMSCGRTISSYSKVYSFDTNLSVGYNLIVIPPEQRFITHEGDRVGFYRNISGAAIQTITTGQDAGAYFFPAQDMSNLGLDIKNGVALNVSFRIKLHSSAEVKVELAISCWTSVGLYSLTSTFRNAISSYNDSKALTFRSFIAVQNAIAHLNTPGPIYIEVNSTEVITVNVTRGTNVSCKWYIPNSSLTAELQSPYLKNNTTTEGGVFQYNFSYRFTGYYRLVVTTYNLVSKKRRSLNLFVRQPIEGLKVNMCNGEFAYINAQTCFNSSVTRGTDVNCTWVFKQPHKKKDDYISKKIGETISRGFSQVGFRNFTLYCYNKISTVFVDYSVQVIANPLSIDIPLKVPSGVPVKVSCQVNWSGGKPDSFFEQQGVTGKKGTNMVQDPVLTLYSGGIHNSSTGEVILYRKFKRLLYLKQKVTCKAINYPDLSSVIFVKALYSITGINMTSDCPSRIEVGTKCAFEVGLLRGDSASFTWTVSQGGTRVSVYSEKKRIQHKFVNTGLASVTVNASNEVSSDTKTRQFFVYSLSTGEPRVTVTSPTIPLLQSSSMFKPSSAVAVHLSVSSSLNIAKHSDHVTQTVASILPSSTTRSNSATASITNQIPSLNNAELRHASVGLVGHAIAFSVDRVERPDLFRFGWNWNDKSHSEEASSFVTHTFTEPGQYFITVNISSAADYVLLDGHLTVQYRIEGLLIRDLAVRSSNVLLVRFEILQGTNVTYSVEYGDETGAQLGFLRKLPELVELTHQYSQPGTYSLSISVNSIVGPSTSVQQSVIISEAPCVLDGLRMLGTGESSAQCPEIQQEYEYSLYSSLKINCQDLDELKYDWKVENVLNGSITEVSSFPKDVLSSNVLFLTARSLQGGLYKFTLAVTAIPLGISKVATGFLRVRTPKLLVVIDCGSERVMPWNHDIILNASSSRDPNDIDVGNKASDSLSFEWFCDANRSVSCFNGSINNKKSALIFPPRSLEVNASYEFFVVVTKGMRQAQVSQIIKVVAGNFPPLCVRCKENCASKVTAAKEFILSGEGCQDNKNTGCKWELYGPPLLNGRISKRFVDLSRLISVSYAKEFHLDPSNLIPNRTYTIFFNNNSSGFWAEYSVRTDMPPSGGSCVVSPSEGVEIETQFQITCTDWTDEDSPLWYEFFLSHPVHGPLLLFYGWMPDSVGLFLPAGSKENDFNVDLFVKITDVLGSYRTVPLQAKVRSFSPEDGSVSSILVGIVSGPDSMLDKLLAAGEFHQASQLMTTVITVLNEDSTQAHDRDSPDTNDRMEVRRRVIEGLSQQCCSSPQGIQLALGGLLQAVGVTAELSPDANVDGAHAFSNMAQALVTKFKSVRAASETRGIIDGLNMVMKASVDTSNEVKLEHSSDEIKDWIDDSNEARNKQYQEKSEMATNKSLEGVNYAAQKILDYQRKGDPPSHVTSGLMKLMLARQSPRDIDNATLVGGEVTFQFPRNVTIDKLKQFDTVNTKVITMSQTPFISNDAIPIDTPVSTLELLETSGKEIEIRDLPEPVSIFLSLNQSENDDLNNMTGVIDSEMNITVFKIESGGDYSFYFTIKCSGAMNAGQELILVLRRNSKATTNNFDLRWNLSSCNNTLKKLISKEYLNNSEELYLGVKLAEASNLTNGASIRNEVSYAVSVKAIGCYYWNERMQAWMTDGCKVGPLTTPERVECQCNHLTWFGSRVFVPPNKLHFDIILKRIKDPSNYAPVLSVLCVTFGLYLLVIVWARREDRKDRYKTGLTVSPSNRIGDAHAYKVVISTGMRRHAGTTANVAMTITGERGESHPHLLKNNRRMALARGSTDSFLVTTSETLGELAYIRVWHDNFGKDPAWFVKQICIREIDTDRVWYFVCESWLAVDEGDGMIDRIFPVASNTELKEFRRLFLTKAYKDLTDSHLWFSVVWRPPQSPFTRVQRVSCCLSLLLCTMMANALWYEADNGRYTAVELGPFEFSWEQVSIGICSSLVVFPINLLLVHIFRNCRPRPVPKSGPFSMKIRPRCSSTNTVITLVKYESRDSCTFGTSCPTSQYQSVSKVSPRESPNSRNKNISLLPAMRLGLLPSFSVSLGAGASTDSTNDIRSLLPCDSLSGSPTRDHENTLNTAGEQDTPRAKGLPWWFVYVGWFLVIVTSLTAATVTLLYGIEFGQKKSSQWLLSMFFSVTQDIFVSQPLKVVALATFFAYIFKKRNKIALSSPARLTREEHWLQNQLQHSEDDFEEHPKAPPVEVPTEDALQHARDRAQKERTMHAILLDLGTFLVFTFLVLLIAYGFRDRDAFRQNDAVAKVLLRQNFSGGFFPDRYSQIIRQRDMWDWTENALLPSLYNLPSYFYTGKAPKFMEGESGLVVGVARLRQHRAKKDSCSVAPVAKDFFSRCVAEYGITSEDKQDYATRWKSLLNDSRHQTQTSSSPWHYSSASELDGYPYIGGLETYSGGGYVLQLSHIYYKALRQVKAARDKLWLDHYTRSLFMEFTLYNPNSNLFCAVTLVMETPPTGGVFPHSEVIAYRLYRYVGDFQSFILACEVFFLAFVLYFTYREAKKLYKTRRMYFAEIWNLMDLTVLILCWIAISYYFICLGLRKWTINLYHKDPTKFISFQYVSTWQLMFESVLGVTVFVTCIKFIKMFRFNRRIFLLSCTLKQASGELLEYLVVFSINFLAFSQIYHFLLGSSHDSFNTLSSTMQKLLSVLLGKFSYHEMRINSYRVLGAMTFFVYIVVTNFLFLNVLIAIIIESFKVVKQQNDKMQNEFEMLDFITKRLKDFLGIRALNKTADSQFQYTNKAMYKTTSRREKYKMAEKLEQALDRLECYIDVINEIENEDDMLCCVVSRRIHRSSSRKATTVEHFL